MYNANNLQIIDNHKVRHTIQHISVIQTMPQGRECLYECRSIHTNTHANTY